MLDSNYIAYADGNLIVKMGIVSYEEGKTDEVTASNFTESVVVDVGEDVFEKRVSGIQNLGSDKTLWLLFSGGSYYPQGGALDFTGQYRSISEAKKKFNEIILDCPSDGPLWGHIAEAATMKVILKSVPFYDDETIDGKPFIWRLPAFVY